MRRAVLMGFLAGCAASAPPPETASAPPRPSFTGSRVRSFSDTFAVTSMADAHSILWVGTTHGLLKWDLAAARYLVIGTHEGLPAARIAAVTSDVSGNVWVATSAGLSRLTRGSWSNLPPAPVGPFVTGLSGDGKTMWAGGPEGLARLRGKTWERYIGDTSVTALASLEDGSLWVGTAGKGVLRIIGERLEQWSSAQGCETDVVRGLAVAGKTVLAVGESAAGPRAAWFDGSRFHSYAVDGPLLEWAATAAGQLLAGAGAEVFSIQPIVPKNDEPPPPPPAKGPVQLLPTGNGAARDPKPVTLAANLPSSVLEEPAVPSKNPRGARSPRVDTQPLDWKLPEGVTAVGGSPRGLLVGTRFLGVARVENGVVRRFRTADLSANGERITVACTTLPMTSNEGMRGGNDDCYLSTGGHAWRYDGQAFERAIVDPEEGARVLAIVRDPKGEVLALHRGASDPHLRISSVVEGRWHPVGMQEIKVPVGVPDLNFAEFTPDGSLWVGLRYFDNDMDPVDYGVAELRVAAGQVVYHRHGSGKGLELPHDVVAMYWRAADEAWFATRSGVLRLKNRETRLFTENDNLQTEFISDIGPGPRGDIWVATRHGTGVFDGRIWSFPKMGPFYLRSSALGHDARGHVFIGTDRGLHCVGDCPPEAVDARRGLLDDAVIDLTVDARNRVWVLTGKGISIVDN